MSEMYKYLEQHAYISKNKKSNYQFELSKERAEAIANKCDNLLQQKENIRKEAIEYINSNEFIGRIRLSSDNKQAINKLLEILDKENK